MAREYTEKSLGEELTDFTQRPWQTFKKAMKEMRFVRAGNLFCIGLWMLVGIGFAASCQNFSLRGIIGSFFLAIGALIVSVGWAAIFPLADVASQLFTAVGNLKSDTAASFFKIAFLAIAALLGAAVGNAILPGLGGVLGAKGGLWLTTFISSCVTWAIGKVTGFVIDKLANCFCRTRRSDTLDNDNDSLVSREYPAAVSHDRADTYRRVPEFSQAANNSAAVDAAPDSNNGTVSLLPRASATGAGHSAAAPASLLGGLTPDVDAAPAEVKDSVVRVAAPAPAPAAAVAEVKAAPAAATATATALPLPSASSKKGGAARTPFLESKAAAGSNADADADLSYSPMPTSRPRDKGTAPWAGEAGGRERIVVPGNFGHLVTGGMKKG